MRLLPAVLLLPLSLVTAYAGTPTPPLVPQIDTTKHLVVLPFEASAETKPGFLDAARASVVAYLKEMKLFASVAAVDTSEVKANTVELAARLVDFNAGNAATRIVVGLGSGRASASFEFSLKDLQSGQTVWKKKISEKASYWSNNASSASQRQELPDKIAESLVKELKAGKK